MNLGNESGTFNPVLLHFLLETGDSVQGYAEADPREQSPAAVQMWVLILGLSSRKAIVPMSPEPFSPVSASLSWFTVWAGTQRYYSGVLSQTSPNGRDCTLKPCLIGYASLYSSFAFH